MKMKMWKGDFTVCDLGTFCDPATCQEAAEFMSFVFIIAPTAHPEACLAEWMSILIQGDALREALYGAPSLIGVDQGIEPPVFKQTIGGEVVVCGIEAEVCGSDAGFMSAKSIVLYDKGLHILAGLSRGK